MRQTAIADTHRTGGSRLRSAHPLLRILPGQRGRRRSPLKRISGSCDRGIVKSKAASLSGAIASSTRGKFVAAHFGIFATLSAATAELQSPRDYRDLMLHSPRVHRGTTTFRSGDTNHGE